MTPFIGVRISWLMVARNELFRLIGVICFTARLGLAVGEALQGPRLRLNCVQ